MCWADPAERAKRQGSVFYAERLLSNSIVHASWEEIEFCGCRRIGVLPQKWIYLLIRIEIIPHAVPGTVNCHFAALKAALKPSCGVCHHLQMLMKWNPIFWCYLWLWLLLVFGKNEFIFCNHFSIWLTFFFFLSLSAVGALTSCSYPSPWD